MNKKYELTDEAIKVGRHTLHRIKALKDFSDIKKGDLGGFVESEENLSLEGNCWIYDKGCVWNHGCVSDNGFVSGNEYVCDNGFVFGNGHVSGHGHVCGDGYEFISTLICVVELNSMQNSSEIAESTLDVLEKKIQSCPAKIRQTSYTVIEDVCSLFTKHIITDGIYKRRNNTKYHIKKLLNYNKHLPTNMHNPNHGIHKTQYSRRT